MYRLMWCVLCHGCVVDRWSSDDGLRERPVHLQWPSVGLTPAPAFPKGSIGVTIAEPRRCSQQWWESKKDVWEDLNGWWFTSAWIKASNATWRWKRYLFTHPHTILYKAKEGWFILPYLCCQKGQKNTGLQLVMSLTPRLIGLRVPHGQLWRQMIFY